MIPLIALEMFFLIAGTAIKIITFDGMFMDYFPDIRLGTLFTNVFNIIPIIILLLSAMLLHSSKAEILFKTSLIVGVLVSFKFFFAFILTTICSHAIIKLRGIPHHFSEER